MCFAFTLCKSNHCKSSRAHGEIAEKMIKNRMEETIHDERQNQ